MPAEMENVTDAIILAIQSLGLVDEQEDPQPAIVVYKDEPSINPRVDPPPRIIVSPDKRNQTSRLFSALNGKRLFPVQVTFFGVSNRATAVGKGLIQQWKEATWAAFMKQQPRILQDHLDNLFTQYPSEASPIDRGAWREMYDVQILFILVELEISLA